MIYLFAGISSSVDQLNKAHIGSFSGWKMNVQHFSIHTEKEASETRQSEVYTVITSLPHLWTALKSLLLFGIYIWCSLFSLATYLELICLYPNHCLKAAADSSRLLLTHFALLV